MKLLISINIGSWGARNQEFVLQLALVFNLEKPGGSSSGEIRLWIKTRFTCEHEDNQQTDLHPSNVSKDCIIPI